MPPSIVIRATGLQAIGLFPANLLAFDKFPLPANGRQTRMVPSLRRTKATLIYRRTGNLRAVQLLLGHMKIESTVRYLGIEVDDALTIAEQVDV